MIEKDIHARIDEALAGRMSQRSFVDRLAGGWEALVGGLDRLVEMLEAAERSVEQNPAVPRPAQFRTAFDALLRGVDGDGGPRLAALRTNIGAAGRQIEAAAARVRRDTVNIGVIGGTKVGKSTLLRTITNLPDTVVPSTRFNPTTASASSIYHTDGTPRATLLLHTWESFRDEYLAPLHELAGAGPVPRDVAAFRSMRYARAGSAEAGEAKADDYLRKLDAAHRSLASYEQLLTGAERTATVDFASLRPYVAYPRRDAGDPENVQPYHAVRSVRIEQAFLEGAATRLGLIDLPGAGEAGLDIDRQFLRQVKQEIDLLVMVKRGDRKGASYLAEDSYTRNLADSARGGVPLDDYYVVVVNRDRANDPEGSTSPTPSRASARSRRSATSGCSTPTWPSARRCSARCCTRCCATSRPGWPRWTARSCARRSPWPPGSPPTSPTSRSWPRRTPATSATCCPTRTTSSACWPRSCATPSPSTCTPSCAATTPSRTAAPPTRR
ncbi:GTPase family protein [Dactylosporangium darangshiense]|uniref:hypothetical protein n=1 Tax=Dactylosporangium darangshiense TaxID=579108 RepID=UPI00362DF51C